MINLTMRSQGAVDRSSLSSINNVTEGAVEAQTIHSLNTRKERHAPGSARVQSSAAQSSTTQSSAVQPPMGQPAAAQSSTVQPPIGQPAAARPSSVPPSAASSQPAPAPAPRPVPPLQKMVQKGQKTALGNSAPLHTLKVCLGWNTTNAQCDVDVSAFLLDNTGKVPGDDWFIFYGQTESPDHSTVFCPENTTDRESITICLEKLDPAVKKIVFVLTIHEALERKLHFGMVQDAYIRILDGDSREELVSFKMDEYYTNIVSMMIGEIYLHNGIWKFNAIGNGVAKDLSGLCSLYGVQVDG